MEIFRNIQYQYFNTFDKMDPLIQMHASLCVWQGREQKRIDCSVNEILTPTNID